MNKGIKDAIDQYHACPPEKGKELLMSEGGQYLMHLMGMTASAVLSFPDQALITFYCIGLGELLCNLETQVTPAEEVPGAELISTQDRLQMILELIALAYRTAVYETKQMQDAGELPEHLQTRKH